MSDQVNLLKIKEVKEGKSKLVSVSFLFLLITVVLAVGMLLYLFILKNQEKNLIDAQAQNSQELAQFKDKKILYLSTEERIKQIVELLQTKDKITNRYLGVSQIIPGSVTIENLSISKNTANLTLSSLSLSAINDFLERNLKELPADNVLQVKRVQIDSLGVRESEGFYSVGISIEFM